MALNWYLKKEFFDPIEGIEDVLIHYTCTPLGQEPGLTTLWESRPMPAGESLKSGVGEVAKYGPPAPSVSQHVHPRLRKKVLKMPNEVWDEEAGRWTGNYLLHYYYEVSHAGERFNSPVLTDEIQTRDVVVEDPLGILGGVCANWSVDDWDAPQFSPTEDPQFVERYGEDHPLRQFKFYGIEEREAFGVAKKAALDSLPLPHRFTARLSAPVGATVRLRFHVGDWGLPEHARWENYWLDESFVMTAATEPLVFTPLGTEVAAAPLSIVAPELLIGNPYAPLLAADRPAETAEAGRVVETVVASPSTELVSIR